MVDETDESGSAAIAMYTPLALASLALVTILRQNLLVSRAPFRPWSSISHASNDSGVISYLSFRSAAPKLIRVLNGAMGQALMLALFFGLAFKNGMPLASSAAIVAKAVGPPALLMLLVRLVSWLDQQAKRDVSAAAEARHGGTEPQFTGALHHRNAAQHGPGQPQTDAFLHDLGYADVTLDACARLHEAE